MSETVQIPKGWELKKISQLCTVVRGGSPRPKGDPLYFGGSIPWIMISDATRNKGKFLKETKEGLTEAGVPKSRFLKSETLILTNSATICLPKILKIDGCIHDGFLAFLNLKEIDRDFLYYFFLAYRTKITKTIARGLGQKNLNIDLVSNIEIPFPPIPIQKKIVQKLDDILGQLEEKKKAILEILERQKKHQLLLSNNYLSHKTAELIPVENAPSHWELIKLGDTFDESDKKWLPNGKSELVNYIGLENIESNTGTLVRFSPTESSKIKSNKTIFTKNMVLYGKLRPYLNKVLLPTFDGICSTDILGLNLKSNIDRTFLAYFLRSWHVLSPVNRSVHGTKMPRTKIQVLQEIPIALPPIGEQKEIIKKIIRSDKTTSIIKNSIQEIQEKAEKSIQYQEHLQSSILDAAFSGKLVK